MRVKPNKAALDALACEFYDAQQCGPPAEMWQERDERLRAFTDQITGKVPKTQREAMRQFGARAMILLELRGKNQSFKKWVAFTVKLVKLFGMPKPAKPVRPPKPPKPPKQRDPAAIRAELIDSVADDLNSAQVQSMVEGRLDKRRLDGVTATASQSMGGDSFIPILRRLEGPLLTDEQWKEFLFRIPYR